MISFGQFAGHMQRAARESPGAITETIAVTMKSVALEAKGYIGHQMPEWPPLAERTVTEKTRLGFVGRVSATDPLLRTGELRASIDSGAAGLMGVVGSKLKKALWMEMGTLKPTGSTPPRPYIGLAMSRVHGQARILFGRLAVRLLSPPGSGGR